MKPGAPLESLSRSSAKRWAQDFGSDMLCSLSESKCSFLCKQDVGLSCSQYSFPFA